jgi:uncharacterized membrane protein HdeD (DUF308 family)
MSILEFIRKDVKKAKWTGWILVIAGIVALASPLVAGLSIVVLIGALLIVSGIAHLLFVFRAGSFRSGLLLVLLGVLSLLAGLYVVNQPAAALGALTLFLAAYFVASGVVEIIAAFGDKPTEGWGWMLFSGIVSLLLGVMIWRQFPLSGVWAVGVLVGVRMLMSGVTFITIGGAAGRVVKKVDEHTA